MHRRHFLRITATGVGLFASGLVPGLPSAVPETLLLKTIPSTGEQLPAVGVGSWLVFNVGNDDEAIKHRTEVLRTFFEYGGGLIDSSPMYGSSEEVIGHMLGQLKKESKARFSATKVWTSSGKDGPYEIELSRSLWGVEHFDLLQVHNLLSWEEHLETLFRMKEQGKLRYVGITTSHGRRHGELEKIMHDFPIDFVQATYNVLDREVEDSILPLCADKGIAFIANRPFRRKSLIDDVINHPLPAWAKEFDCNSWPTFLLKFIISHPAVTCAIPATSKVDHMKENMLSMTGRQPDADMRRKMIAYVEGLQ